MEVPTIDLATAPQWLLDLVEEAERPGEVVLTDQGEPVAKIIALPHPARTARRPGSARGVILHMADDFDATPEEFRDL